MFGFLIIIVVVIALIKRQRYRAMARDEWWREHAGEARTKFDRYARRFQRKAEQMQRKAEDLTWCQNATVGKTATEFGRYADRFKRKAERFARRAEERAQRYSRSYEKSAEDFERKADIPPVETEAARFKTNEEREAYRRARKRAAAEASFYVHLMWYGLVIGFLFLINLLTTSSYPWFLWPALGWGFCLMSHFTGVFGWHWVRERVFDPAIQREVQREVLHEKEVLHTEKQASLDELTATFAHEIRNPIAAAKSLVQQMGEDPTSNENVEYAKVALDELARVERSVSHLLKYAKEEDYKFENVNLSGVLDSALTQMRAKIESGQVGISRNYIVGPTVRADADKLRQVFSNIIDNAIDAMESKPAGRQLGLEIRTSAMTGTATVIIRDNGCGIPEDKLTKIFNPFYTSKANGTGLGMAVARKVVEAHRGTIEVHSHPGQGTEFEISLPLSDGVRERVAPAGDGEQPSTIAAANGRAVQE